MVAETTGAVVSVADDGSPTLWFPLQCVDHTFLAEDDAGLVTEARRPAAAGAPEAHVAFDHDRVRVRVEVLDPMGGAGHDLSVKRFPVWGDAADLVDILDVRRAGPGRYTGVARGYNRTRAVVEGSQMLGQAIVAAGREHPGRRVVSAHMVFLRAADPAAPLDLVVEGLGAGRSFATVTVAVSQGGRRCAAGTLLLDATAPDSIRHSVAPPDVAGPYDSEPCDMSVVGRDIRVVGGTYDDDPEAPIGPPVIDAWVRFAEAPEDELLNAAMLAQFTGHMSIAAAMRPHAGVSQQAAHRTLSTAINAIALSFHAPVRANRWMLYHHDVTFAGDGMTHAECRVHDEGGALLASFSVDAMVRPFVGGEPVDERRAL